MNRVALAFTLACGACASASPSTSQPATTVVCPSGSTWDGHACAANVDTTCPSGTEFVTAKGCVAIVSTSQPPPQPSSPPPPPENSVPRTVWIEHMIANLPPKLCAAPYFVQCFKTTDVACGAAMTRLTRSCIHDVEKTLPHELDSDSGRREGTKVGQCVGTAYELELRADGRFANTPECNDVTRWR